MLLLLLSVMAQLDHLHDELLLLEIYTIQEGRCNIVSVIICLAPSLTPGRIGLTPMLR